MDIEFHGQYSKDILFKALSLINKPSKRSAILRILLFIVFLSIYIPLVVMVANNEDRSSYEVYRLIRHFLTIIVLGYFIFQPYISSYFTASRLWNTSVMRKPVSGVISSQGITYSSSPSNEIISWENFSKVCKSEDIIAMTFPGKLPLIFSRSFFNNAEDWAKFQKLVEYKIKEVQ